MPSDRNEEPGRSIVHTPSFTRNVEGLLDEDGIRKLELRIVAAPMEGVLIPDTGGVRKIRVAARGKGRRGGARVVYFFADVDDLPIYLLDIYSKGDVDDLTEGEKQVMRQFAKSLLAARKNPRPI